MSCGSHHARNVAARIAWHAERTPGRSTAMSAIASAVKRRSEDPGEQPERHGQQPLQHRRVAHEALPPAQDVVEPGERREVLVVELVVVADLAGDPRVAGHRGVVAVVVGGRRDERPERDHHRHHGVDHPRPAEPPPAGRPVAPPRSRRTSSAAVASSIATSSPTSTRFSGVGLLVNSSSTRQGDGQRPGGDGRDGRGQQVDARQQRRGRAGQLGAVAGHGQHGVVGSGEHGRVRRGRVERVRRRALVLRTPAAGAADRVGAVAVERLVDERPAERAHLDAAVPGGHDHALGARPRPLRHGRGQHDRPARRVRLRLPGGGAGEGGVQRQRPVGGEVQQRRLGPGRVLRPGRPVGSFTDTRRERQRQRAHHRHEPGQPGEQRVQPPPPERGRPRGCRRPAASPVLRSQPPNHPGRRSRGGGRAGTGCRVWPRRFRAYPPDTARPGTGEHGP